MDVLRNLFGNLTSGIIRLLVTVGILAAVYFFAIRPVLDTTNHAIDSANESFAKSFGPTSDVQRNIQQAVRQANRQIAQANRQVARATRDVPRTTTVRRTLRGLTPGEARRLNRCLRRAGSNLRAFNACFDRFSKR